MIEEKRLIYILSRNKNLYSTKRLVEEVEAMGISESAIEIDLEVGESVKVISGPLKEFVAIIQEINLEKHKMKALIDMFGRETLAELDFNQVEKLV